MLDLRRVLASAPKKPEDVELRPLYTVWGERLAEYGELRELHPHPQFERDRFLLLDGRWQYRFVTVDNAAVAWRSAEPPTDFEGLISVPFSPEAPLSGVNRQLAPDELLWYRRTFELPAEAGISGTTDRCILHFEAVDYACACYCNGRPVGEHVGGYLPFSFDITENLLDGTNELTVCVYDPSDTGVQLRGKQRLERGGIWYTAQSGIWQSVWLEVVPERHIVSLEIDARADTGELTLNVGMSCSFPENERTTAPGHPSTTLTARVFDGTELVGSGDSSVSHGDPQASHPENEFKLILTITLTEPHLWSPGDPFLYRLELIYGSDTIRSYCAFRTVTVESDDRGVKRLCINHKPCFLRGVLDQGYWPDGLMTAPSDDALIFDIQSMKDLGFNMLRKHIKIECDRWYYHCDRLGMLVWQDMVSGGSRLSSWHSSYKPTFFRSSWGNFSDDAPDHYDKLSAGSEAYRNEWSATCLKTVAYLKNHPSIITWVLFNEAWGQFEAQKATKLVQATDPTRPIDAVSGWYDRRCGDFLSVHNYFRPLEVYEDEAEPKRAFVISEFGGLSYHLPDHSSLATSYGYGSFSDLTEFKVAVQKVLSQADALEKKGLAGFVYTQLSDVEEETNGILSYDRRINKLEKTDGQERPGT